MDKENLKDHLKEMFPKGSTAYTTVTKVAPSGLSRHIKVVAPFESSSNKQIRLSNQSYNIAKFLDWTYKDNTNSVFVGGCGMDMGFHLIYTLSSVLYDDGYAIKQSWI
jgi:hypothetical protein|tara:strand:- start:193 stop:516 length:324 start_codon:yes stop_codon:yes gene_type:complete